jgi:CO dehydrogenase nickel-insertion accessory protein CooC1
MKFIRNNLAGTKILGFIPYDGRLIEADLGGRGVSQDFSKQIEGILGGIEVSRP